MSYALGRLFGALGRGGGQVASEYGNLRSAETLRQREEERYREGVARQDAAIARGDAADRRTHNTGIQSTVDDLVGRGYGATSTMGDDGYMGYERGEYNPDDDSRLAYLREQARMYGNRGSGSSGQDPVTRALSVWRSTVPNMARGVDAYNREQQGAYGDAMEAWEAANLTGDAGPQPEAFNPIDFNTQSEARDSIFGAELQQAILANPHLAEQLGDISAYTMPGVFGEEVARQAGGGEELRPDWEATEGYPTETRERMTGMQAPVEQGLEGMTTAQLEELERALSERYGG